MKKLVFAAAMAAVLSASVPALAEVKLQSAAPAPGSTVDFIPQNYMLYFGGTADLTKTQVSINGPKGEPVELGPPSTTGGMLVGSLTGRMGEGDYVNVGTYTVKWQAVGTDGKPAAGSYTFTIKP